MTIGRKAGARRCNGMRLNQKELKIVKLHEKGFDDAAIAKRLGYAGDLLSKGVEHVRTVLKRASAQKEV